MQAPSVQYITTSDGVRIAYTVSGSGPAAVVLTDPSVSHVELEWSQPVLRDIYGRLAQNLTLIRIDIRGTGLSDRVTSVGPETIYGEIRAVVERLGLKRYILGAVQIMSPAAIIYASRYPDEVTHLVLIDGCLSVMQLFTSPQIAAIVMAGQADWTTGTEAIGAFTFGAGRDESITYGTYVRNCIGQEFFPLAMQATHAHDATPVAKDVRAPTLVVRHAGNTIPVEVPRVVASAIPNASMVSSPGLWADEPVQLAERMLDWIEKTPAAPEIDKVAAADTSAGDGGTAIIMFADIVDSTALTERLGDAAFRSLARSLDEHLRSVISAHQGVGIDGKLLGDGVLATFTSARDAISAALACGLAGEEGGLPLHLGLHAGDVIRESNNVFGGAVNIAARISGLSAPGEVLVSDVVRGLARTSAGVAFVDRGEHALKGISEPQRVYTVRPAAEAGALTPTPPTSPEAEPIGGAMVLAPELEESFVGGRYLVRRVLGEGGQKTVYLVHDTVLARDCAFALLRTDFSSQEEVSRMRREAQAMARLGAHQNIVTVHDLGEEQGRPFIVCEYVPGGDLQTILRDAQGPLPLRRAVTIAADVCRALALAHTAGIVHRDIKPANIWLNEDGSAKLGDFGIASAAGLTRVTMAGMVVGTAAYMPPEQAQGQEVDARSDLYALGCVLYELVTGNPPFVATDPLAVVSQHVHAVPPSARRDNSKLPKSVDGLITRLLAKDKLDRPESAAAVAAELDRIATTL